MGVGGHPEPILKNKCTLFFEKKLLERPLLRYLLKTVLHCKGSGIWVDAITQVKYYLPPNSSDFASFAVFRYFLYSMDSTSLAVSRHFAY